MTEVPQKSDATLYDRIGGRKVIDQLMAAFYEHVIEDPDLSPYFKDVDLEKVRHMQGEFFSAALGGPVEYTGLELAHVHVHMGITRNEFSKFVHLLFDTLNEEHFSLSEKDIAEIIDRVNLYVDDIVGKGGMDA